MAALEEALALISLCCAGIKLTGKAGLVGGEACSLCSVVVPSYLFNKSVLLKYFPCLQLCLFQASENGDPFDGPLYCCGQMSEFL